MTKSTRIVEKQCFLQSLTAKQKTKQKQNKNYIKTYQKQSQHLKQQLKKQKGRNIKHDNKNKNNWRKNETAKNESNLGFTKGMLGKFFQRKKQTLTKEKATTKRKTEETPKWHFPIRGWWTKTKEKMEFWKGRQKENKNRTAE